MDYRLQKPLVYLLSVAFFFACGVIRAQSSVVAAPLPAFLAAHNALLGARNAGADVHVPADFIQAQQALADAETLLAKRRKNEAERMAYQAQRLAELAGANSRHLLLRDEVDRKTTANAALRRELLLGREQPQQ